MTCRICGADLPEGAMFCGECGSSTSATPESRRRPDPRPGDTFRLNAASRAEMLRPQIKKSENTWEGLAWHLEQFDGIPLLFSHAGSADGWYCMCGASAERRSGLMVMLNGDAYVPFLMKMLASPSGAPVEPKDLWSDFARRFFAAA